MAKKILTQEDLDNNPELVEQGLKVGDEIDVPDEDVPSAETNDNEQSNAKSDDTGGSQPPPDKGRP